MQDSRLRYNIYHLHSMLSNGTINIDSVTPFKTYVKAAKECGMTALAFSEHGNIFEWVHKKEAVEAAGMKYIHAIEAYLTEDNGENNSYFTAELINLTPNKKKKAVRVTLLGEPRQSDDGKWIADVADPDNPEITKTVWIDIDSIKTEHIKTRDNYHCVLISKNYDGVKELNKLTSASFNREDDCHFYSSPRITFDELFKTSDNILVTTACLGGVLHKGDAKVAERFLNFLRNNKHRCYLEIQHHLSKEQIDYNKMLYEIHKATGIPLIVGTDTHAISEDHMECRAILQAAKGVHFNDEDEWNLVFKTPQELYDTYKRQNSLPMDVVAEAMENTVRLTDSVETFELDRSAKYPRLYGDKAQEVFKQKINEGVKWRGIQKYPNYREYVDRIHYEYDTYVHNDAVDFMLLDEDCKSEMRRRGIKFGYSRGSVSGSLIAYLLGITEIDSVKFHLNFERFMSRERISLADIDTDWYDPDRKVIRKYLQEKEGLYCCDIVTFNTIALKGAIKDICRGLFQINLRSLVLPPKLDEALKQYEKDRKEYKKHHKGEDLEMPKAVEEWLKKEYTKSAQHKEIPYDYLAFSEELIKLAENDYESVKAKYPYIFKNVEIAQGVVVSVGNHPAGCVVSPFPIDDWFGTFTTSNDEYPVSVLNMKEIDSLNFVKLDILGLDSMGMISKTCEAAGIDFLTPDNTPDDVAVWNSIREDTTMIFQWESQSATAYLQQLFSDSTVENIRKQNPNFSYIDLFSMGNGAIRPGGSSYRDDLAKGVFKDNGHYAINEYLKPTLGFCIYQEEVMGFLHEFCDFTMGEADIVRRHFAKKTGTEQDIPIIKYGGSLQAGGRHIKGFLAVMNERYGTPPEEAEKIVEGFIAVVKDSSDYLFSQNHSDPYSWVGYICGYLRYYYPLEFISTAFNIFIDKKEKSLAITEYARKHGIRITPIRFRESRANYGFDKETHTIQKGIASINGLNAAVAEEMYALRDNRYKSFIDLMIDLKNKTSLTSSQLDTLIALDFFDEFGDANFLAKVKLLFDELYGKVSVSKVKADKYNLDYNILAEFSQNVTDKTFTKVDTYGFLLYMESHLIVEPRTLSDKIKSQSKYLGYVDVVDPKASKVLVVLAISTKYSPRLQVYAVKTGIEFYCKIRKTTYKNKQIKKGDIIRVLNQKYEPKKEKQPDGSFLPIPGTKELWLTKYEFVK